MMHSLSLKGYLMLTSYLGFQNLAQHSNGKLCTYVTFKTNFGCEKYLSIISSFDLRRCLSRLRLSAHALRIERGRYQGTPRHNRTCPRCDSGEVEDEKHFLFNCNSLILQQSKLLSCIDANLKLSIIKTN